MPGMGGEEKTVHRVFIATGCTRQAGAVEQPHQHFTTTICTYGNGNFAVACHWAISHYKLTDGISGERPFFQTTKKLPVIRMDHPVHNRACNGYIKPKRPGDACQLFMLCIFGYEGAVGSEQDKGQYNAGKEDMC